MPSTNVPPADEGAAFPSADVHEGGDHQHPPSFYCPISRQCMHDPVVLADGHSYESRHIANWLESHDTSPVTGAVLSQKSMFPNHALRNAIEEYFQQVFSAHRQAIRKVMSTSPHTELGFGSDVSLLRTVDSLMRCSILVNADLSTERVLWRIMGEAKELVGAEIASVFLVDRESGELYSTVNSTGAELRIPLSAGIAGHVATSGDSLIVPDAYSDDRFNKSVDDRTGFRTRNILCMPLKTKKGVIGVAQLINKTNTGVLVANRHKGKPEECDQAPAFTADDRQFLQVFASQAAAAIASSGALETQLPADPESEETVSESETVSKSSQLGDGHDDCLGKSLRCEWLLSDACTSWQMDTLALAELSGNKPLSTLGTHLFEHLGLVEHFHIDRERLTRFLVEIERGYSNDNPYHNRAHAASVMHAMHALLAHGGVGQALSAAEGGKGCQLGRMACLLAAAVHDYQHKGLTNDFLVKAGDERALLYNDRNVNENHHVAAAFAVLQRPECNFLANLPPAEYRRLRGLVIDLVLGTDMAEGNKITKAFTESISSATASDTSGFVPTSAEDALLALQVALKCADVGHLALAWDTHLEWVHRLEAEFFKQGDKEKALGLSPVSFLMDRDKPGVSQTQVGFFDFVVLPLFDLLVRAFPASAPMAAAVKRNGEAWRDIEATLKAETREKAQKWVPFMPKDRRPARASSARHSC